MEAPPSPDSCNSVAGPSNRQNQSPARGGRPPRSRGVARRAESPRREPAVPEDWRLRAMSTRRAIHSFLSDVKRRGEMERIKEYNDSVRARLFGNLYNRTNNNASGDVMAPQLNPNPSIAQTAPMNFFPPKNLAPLDPKPLFIPNPPPADAREPWKPLPHVGSFGWNTKPSVSCFGSFPQLTPNPNPTAPAMVPSAQNNPSGSVAVQDPIVTRDLLTSLELNLFARSYVAGIGGGYGGDGEGGNGEDKEDLDLSLHL